MKTLRLLAWGFLLSIFMATLLAEFVAPAPYAEQFRESPNALPSWQHPLGTDELGRDALSRLLYGSRVSLLLAPAAALLATLIAALVGGVAGYLGGWWERAAMGATDLSLSLPWLFLLITVRALLPLNVSPVASVVITFALLGLLGWSASARVVCAGARALRNSEFILQARACGCSPVRLLFRQVLPNLRPVLPSWGNLLRGLESWPAVAANPWRLAPLALLVIVVSCFQLVLPNEGLSV